jgi:putative tricarboxylic transport membrane protein
MARVNRDTLVAILLLMVCGVFFAASFDIREPDYGQLSPAAWPRAIIVALTVLSLIYLVQSIRKGPEAEGGKPVQQDGEADLETRIEAATAGWRNVVICFVLFLAYLLSMPWLGMLVGGTAFVFLLLTALGGWTPRLLLLHAVVALITVGGMWSIFTYALGVLLPRGELFGSF